MRKVTIGIITYNRLELSKQAIPNIISNIGDVDAEVIIWDNNSTDGTVTWLYELADSDKRISVIPATKNIGVEAFNDISVISEGEFLLKVDNDILVPNAFAEQLVDIYEYIDDEKLAYLGWDLKWKKDKTFALRREGWHYFRPPNGRIEKYTPNIDVFICEKVHDYFMNGSCRLSKKDTFRKIGGHPKGIKYGADKLISKSAYDQGYSLGYVVTDEVCVHIGHTDTEEYRKFKDEELRKLGQLKDV